MVTHFAREAASASRADILTTAAARSRSARLLKMKDPKDAQAIAVRGLLLFRFGCRLTPEAMVQALPPDHRFNLLHLNQVGYLGIEIDAGPGAEIEMTSA